VSLKWLRVGLIRFCTLLHVQEALVPVSKSRPDMKPGPPPNTEKRNKNHCVLI
jgi:hypothetical protein